MPEQEWSDVSWGEASPEYRKRQFSLLCMELLEHEEQKAAAIDFAMDDTAGAEAIRDALDDAIEEAESESALDDEIDAEADQE